MVLPTLGSDSSPGVIPAAPRLVTVGSSAEYSYLINAATDDLELYVQSYPGVGDQNSFDRSVGVSDSAVL
jgi:hypothetical protein